MSSITEEMLKNFADRGRGYVEEGERPCAVSCDALGFGQVAEESDLPESPTLDQGQESSCLAHAYPDAFLVGALVQGVVNARLFSRQYLYHYGRPDKNLDAGMSFANADKALAEHGLPDERHWPYSDKEAFTSPPAKAIQNAVDQKGLFRSHPLAGSYDVLRSLSSGRPCIVGLKKTFGGPHAVMICGHRRNPITKEFELKIKNSWGIFFGDNGYIWLPASLLDDPNEQIGIRSIDYTPSPSEDYAHETA
jgi:hypothetical protein